MKSKSKELYDILKEIDFFCEYIKQPRCSNKDLIIEYSKQLGDEFERALKSVLSQQYGLKDSYSLLTIKNSTTNVNQKLYIDGNGYKIYNSCNFNKAFKIDTFIKKYNFQEKKNYGITNHVEIKRCQEYLNNLLKKIDYSKFKPKKHIFSDVFISYKYNGKDILSGEIDLVIDNKIIDIKTDNEVKKINKEYICQLLFYYSFILLYANLKNESKNEISRIKIEKICIYYATFDYLLEFDLKDLIKKQKEFYDIIYNEFYLVNFRLKDVIKSAVFKKNDVDDYFSKIEFDINEKKMKILESYIKGFNKRMSRIYGCLSDYEKYRLRDFNLCKEGLRKYYETGHLTRRQFELMLASF